MSLLKQKNWFLNLVMMVITPYIYIPLMAYMLNILDENAWYYKWQYWFFGLACLLFPGFIMLMVFEIQMLTKVAEKLEVQGSELYTIPYIWILFIIIPIVGWILLLVMILYLMVYIVIAIMKGKGEKYAK